MNTPTSQPNTLNTESKPLHPYYEEETTSIPPMAPASPSPLRTERTLVLEPGAEIASHLCLKTGRPTRKQVTLALRNPWRPTTWFASRDRIQIGLSRQSLENFRLTRAIAWSFLIVGIAMMCSSFFYGILFLLSGVFLSLAGLMIRAAFPVWCSVKNQEFLEIRGCGEGFLRQYPSRKQDTI